MSVPVSGELLGVWNEAQHGSGRYVSAVDFDFVCVGGV